MKTIPIIAALFIGIISGNFVTKAYNNESTQKLWGIQYIALMDALADIIYIKEEGLETALSASDASALRYVTAIRMFDYSLKGENTTSIGSKLRV